MDRNVIGDVMGKALAESLSARRAWIEIPSIHLLTDRFFVALRKESVDRNLLRLVHMLEGTSRSPQGERG